MSDDNKHSSGQFKGNAAKTAVISDKDLQAKETSSKAAKTAVIPEESISGNVNSGKAAKTAVISDTPLQTSDTSDPITDVDEKPKRSPNDTEARTIASIKKLKVRPKTTTPSTATKRNLMSIIGDTFGAITSSFVTNEDVNKTNFFKTIKKDDNAKDSEIISDGDRETTNSLGSVESHYKLGAQIAEGGQGSIKKALDKLFHRVVAIKSLHDCVKNQESVRSAFLNEARITAQLEHPSIVPIYGLYSDNNKGLHLAMKLIQGNDLRKHLEAVHEQYSMLPKYQIRLRERKMLKQRLEFFLHICDALEYVHSRNVIHRDLKPENIMIGKFNETYIMDWGIAERCDENGVTPSQISGTPCYLPPELLNKQPIDKRSDIYLLGLILYDIVFLHKAYPQEKTPDILREVRDGNYAPMEHEFGIHVDTDLKAIVAKALEFDPEDRYQSAVMLAEDIRCYLGDEAVSVPPHPIATSIARYFRRHSQWFIGAFILMIVLLFAGAAASIIREMNQQIAEEQFESKMTEIYSKGLQAASEFNRTFNEIGIKASIMAIEASIRLETCKEADPSLKFYDYKAGRSPETAPPGMAATKGYPHPVSFETFVYKTTPDTPEADVRRLLTAIYPMQDKFKATINSVQGIMGAAVTSVFLGQENGLEISFPYSCDYSDSFDPRVRPWYKQAIDKKKSAPIWSVPYINKGETPKLIITCSVPIEGTDGKNKGVLGVDVLPSNVLEMLEHGGTIGIKSTKYIISKDGKVYCDSSDALSPKMRGENVNMSEFPDKQLFKRMWSLKNGRLFSNHMRDEVFFFMYIGPLDSLYVEKYDINELKGQY